MKRILAFALLVLMAGPAPALIVDVTVDGSDAIFLAGRTDVTIPDAALPWTGPGTHLDRHFGPTPEEIKETLPPIISVAAGDVIRALDPAVGGVNFFNGFGPPFFGPSGDTTGVSDLMSLDGISGYRGPLGALVGVFLDDSIPSSGPAPSTLDFIGGGIDFTGLTPLLNQIFYIGDGINSGGDFQTFTAPTGATRLALGIPDGFAFVGPPGAYDDNDGSYRVRIGINEIPVLTPEPGTLALMAFGLVAAGRYSRRQV